MIRPLSEEVVNKIAAGEIIQVRSRVFQDAGSRINDNEMLVFFTETK